MLDRSDADQATVRLLVGAASDGTPFFEEVPVERLGGERFRILASPGLLDGLAAGDVFERSDDGTYRLIERSGNLCVQLLYDDTAPHERFDLEVLPRVHELGGWLDGRTERASVLTFPLTAGFAPIEGLMNAWVASTPGGSWSYGNVYGEDGRTPLGWWARQSAE
jgi:hypothetical protein